MQLYKYGRDKLPSETGCVIALGFFDGVHLGHRALLSVAREKATKLGIPFGVFTFDTESEIKKGDKRIYSNEIRQDLIEDMGVDFTVSADFKDLSEMSANRFVEQVLIGELGAKTVVAGFNYRFGKGASADAEDLRKLMREHGCDAIICDKYTVDGTAVSATEIRDRLAAGKIEEANHLLGAPYRIKGEVKHGRGVGTTLGFPTVNTSLGDYLIRVKNGVYRTAVIIGESIYPAITNVGVCPTYEKREIHAETYIIGYDGDLYGYDIEIFFLGYLRGEIEFSSEKELIMQINIDKNRAIKEFGEIKWQELGLK